MNEVALPDIGEIPSLANIKFEPDVIQRFEATDQSTLGSSYPFCDNSDFAEFPGQQDNNPIGFRERIVTKHDGFGFTDWHV